MAAPTPVTKTFWDGTRGSVRWYAAWTTGDQHTDAVVVDISTLSPAPDAIKIRSIDLIINGDVQVDLEIDATTDELVERIIGQTDVSYQFLRDYTDGPNEAYAPDKTATGFTGDLLLTSTNAANLDEVNLYVVFEKS